MSEHAAATSGRPVAHSLRLSTTVAVLVAIAIGIGAWFLVSRATRSSNPSSTTTISVTGPHAATRSGIAATAAALGHPIYWIGARARTTYELTITGNGLAYVRYLPAGVKVGDKHPDFVTVGTYPTKNAYATLAAARKLKGSQVQELTANEIAVTYTSHPHSVYVAWKSSDDIVEIFAPKTLAAQTLARYRQVVRAR
jgi:hypothetical protein